MQHSQGWTGWLTDWPTGCCACQQLCCHLGDADGADLHRLAALHDVHGCIADGPRPQVLQQVARLQQECMPSAMLCTSPLYNSCALLRWMQQGGC